jgi:hypothetical protein
MMGNPRGKVKNEDKRCYTFGTMKLELTMTGTGDHVDPKSVEKAQNTFAVPFMIG